MVKIEAQEPTDSLYERLNEDSSLVDDYWEVFR